MNLAMRCPDGVEAMLERMREEGAGKLKVISDFDFTLTQYWWDKDTEERACSCYKALEDCHLLSEEYHRQAQELQRTYYPKEICPTLPMEEKIAYMEEWVEKANKILVESGLTRETIPLAISTAHIRLRPRVKEFFEMLEHLHIPLLIFSAGLADVAEEVLKQNGIKLGENVKIVSNRMIFDESGKIVDYEHPVYHVFNKDARGLVNDPFLEAAAHRTNILLLGDSLGDIKMANGLEASNLLKIGFLNDKHDKRLEQYLESYHVVLRDDPGFDYPMKILSDLAAGHRA